MIHNILRFSKVSFLLIFFLTQISCTMAERETGRDGRFIAYENGTVLDTRTNLMWAAKDNGSDIDWYGANVYCIHYKGGGYEDWRMPTHNELSGLFDRNKPRPAECIKSYSIYVATKFIDITCFNMWAEEELSLDSASFYFGDDGTVFWDPKFTTTIGYRVLPVRNGKGFAGSKKSDEPMPFTESNVKKYIETTTEISKNLTAIEQEELNRAIAEQKRGQNYETKGVELVKRVLVQPLEKMGYSYDKTLNAGARKVINKEYTSKETLWLGSILPWFQTK